MSAVVEFSKPIPEAIVAKRLGISKATLQRIRKRGEIGYLRIGKKKIVYTEQHLIDYERAQECPAKEKSDQVNSEIIGSRGDQDPKITTGPGTNGRAMALDGPVAKVLALRTLKKRN